MATTTKPKKKAPTSAVKAINKLSKEAYKVNLSGVNVTECIGLTPTEITVFKTNITCIMKEPVRKADKVQKILDKCQFDARKMALIIWMMTT
jgi:hypothetical protein